MMLENSLQALHEALSSAIMRDLAPVPREYLDYSQDPKGTRMPLADRPRITRMERPTEREVRVVMFPQMWGSTAKGYGGMGGAAMTEAYTVVVSTHSDACVYFQSSTLAYRVDLRTVTPEQLTAYREDLHARQLASRREAVTRYGAELPGPRDAS